jgi:hypothetical protein
MLNKEDVKQDAILVSNRGKTFKVLKVNDNKFVLTQGTKKQGVTFDRIKEWTIQTDGSGLKPVTEAEKVDAKPANKSKTDKTDKVETKKINPRQKKKTIEREIKAKKAAKKVSKFVKKFGSVKLETADYSHIPCTCHGVQTCKACESRKDVNLSEIKTAHIVPVIVTAA